MHILILKKLNPPNRRLADPRRLLGRADKKRHSLAAIQGTALGKRGRSYQDSKNRSCNLVCAQIMCWQTKKAGSSGTDGVKTMWTHECTAISALPAHAIWNALKGVHEGSITYEGADTFVLHGPFAQGTRLSVTPVGQDTFESTIVDLVENVTYADEASFGGATLLFRHTLVAVDGGTHVTHRLDISGPTAAEVGPELGPQISSDFDVTMARLLEKAQELADRG